MSFGRPGALSDTFKVLPPQRGSFPLDHDGECKTFMMTYMRCLKANKNDAGACRPEARDYLGCRMDHELMGRDDFANLGLGDVPATGAAGASASASAGASAAAGTGAGTATGAAASGSAGSAAQSGRYVPSERI